MGIYCLTAFAVFIWFYIRHRKQIQLEDAAQLVIGAPGKGQISITNPNPPAVARKTPVRVPVRAPVRRHAVKKKPAIVSKNTLPVKPAGPPGTLDGTLLKAVGPGLTSYQKFVTGNVDSLVHDVTHPGIVPHLGADVSHEPDPVRILKEGVIEGVKGAKVELQVSLNQLTLLSLDNRAGIAITAMMMTAIQGSHDFEKLLPPRKCVVSLVVA
jgi:hypothetical protein